MPVDPHRGHAGREITITDNGPGILAETIAEHSRFRRARLLA